MNRREQLLVWVEEQHAGQMVRRTTIPYLHHLTTVAKMADVTPLGYETGLCHDLLEKTKVTQPKLQTTLNAFGYDNQEARLITQSVAELSDVFTKTAYTDLPKSVRKAKEAERLNTINPLAQTVKYADLIYNIDWMLSHDREHVEKYLLKKRRLLTKLTKGDRTLQQQALQIIDAGLQNFNYIPYVNNKPRPC